MAKRINQRNITPIAELEILRVQLLKGRKTKVHGKRFELATGNDGKGYNSQCSMAWHLMAVRHRCVSPVSTILHFMAALKEKGIRNNHPRPWLELSHQIIADLSGIGPDTVATDLDSLEKAGLIERQNRQGRPRLIKVLRSKEDLVVIEGRYWSEVEAEKRESKIRKGKISATGGEQLLPTRRKKRARKRNRT